EQGAENRSAPRRSGAAIPSITGLRISPHGVEAKLVNISETGVLAECGERLKPGSAVTVVFEGTFTPRTMEGRVARNSLASMGPDGRLRYHVGIAFAKPISLPAEEEPEIESEGAPPAAAMAAAPELAAPTPVVAAPPAPPPAAAPAIVPLAPLERATPVAVPQAARNRW